MHAFLCVKENYCIRYTSFCRLGGTFFLINYSESPKTGRVKSFLKYARRRDGSVWFFPIIYQRSVRLRFGGGGAGSILGTERTLFRRGTDHPPKGRQFARSNGHWRRSRRRGWGTTYTIIMTEAI